MLILARTISRDKGENQDFFMRKMTKIPHSADRFLDNPEPSHYNSRNELDTANTNNSLQRGGRYMKHLHFDIDRDGFYGAYWTGKAQSDCAVIAMRG